MKRLAAMGALRLSLYLKEHGIKEYWDKFPLELNAEISKDELDNIDIEYMLNIEEDNSGLAVLYQLLNPEDDAGELAWCCLELAVLYYMEKQIGEVFASICLSGRRGVTLSLAGKIWGGDTSIIDTNEVYREAFERCELLFQTEYPMSDMGESLFCIDDRLVQWILDTSTSFSHPFVKNRCTQKKNKSNIWQKTKLEILEEIQMKEENFEEIKVVAIAGENGNGRSYLVQEIAEELQKPILMVDVSFLGNLDNILVQWRKILREMLLTPTLVCVRGIEKVSSWDTMVSILADEYEEIVKKAYHVGIQEAPAKRPLFFTCMDDVKLVFLLKQIVIQKQLPLANMAQRAAFWEYLTEKYLGGLEIPTQELAVKMKLPIGSMEKVIKRFACLSDIEQKDVTKLFKYCYEVLDDGRYDNIKRVETRYTYDDLKLEESQKQIIIDICAQVEYRKKVLNDWNLQSRYSYGISVSAIFSGPPGTGKTMAAHVMAGILGLELFKVDLSQIVDKYIGETEKRLEEVFKKAERSNMILFFDEADAVIGKRSETKEAKDKYANTEVAYLLQRMEEYDGIVILATNYSQNIDAAFIRRIRFVVNFPLPDENTRKEIWMSSFSKETPTSYIDYDYLAKQFEFSGGQIKNVIWNACFFAAKEEEAVEMRHIVRAIKMELMKDKKVSFQEALGSYAHLVY